MKQIDVIIPANIRFPMERANAIQIVNTCYALAQAGAQTHLIVRKSTGLSTKESLEFFGLSTHRNLHIHRLPAFNTRRSRSLRYRSFQALCSLCVARLCLTRKTVPKFIYLREIGPAKLFIRLRPILHTPVIVEMHGIGHLVKRDYHQLMSDRGLYRKDEHTIHVDERFVCEEADGVVAITENLRKLISTELCQPKRSAVIHDGTSLFEAKEAVRKEPRQVCYVGQLYPWKGVDLLIRAMKKVNGTLIIVGGLPYESDMRRLKRLTTDLGVGDKVKFMGFVPPSEVVRYLRESSVAALPLPDNIIARHFTSPLKLFEYMSAGVPIVASDLPTMREILSHGKDALLVPPEDTGALAAGIQRLLDDGALASRLSKQAKENVKKFTWAARADKILAFAREVLGPPL